MYYNTTNQTDPMLSSFKAKTFKQDDEILYFFARNPLQSYTPFEIHRAIFDDSVPITSIRRSITNLTNSGKLVKLHNKTMERYGRPNYCWRFNDN